MKYLSLLFLMSCAPNTMGNYILDNKNKTHYYVSDYIQDGSTHWCLKHAQMEKVEIKNPKVSNKKENGKHKQKERK